MRWCDVGHQGIAWRAPHPLAHTVEQARRQDQARGRGNRKQWFGQRAEGIAGHRQALAFAKVVAQDARENLDDQSRCFGQPLDQTHDEGTRAQGSHHEQRQQAMDHF